MSKQVYTNSVGRRKTAVARVYLKPGSGDFTVNNKPYEVYFGRKVLSLLVNQPLVAVDGVGKYDIKINVNGGGIAGQAGAVSLGIARALLKTDDSLKPVLRAKGLLTRDAREVERKKYGRHKARKRPQFSKR